MKPSVAVLAVLAKRERSEAWLAHRLGYHRVQLWHWLHESPGRPAPADLYHRIADVLELPASLFQERSA